MVGPRTRPHLSDLVLGVHVHVCRDCEECLTLHEWLMRPALRTCTGGLTNIVQPRTLRVKDWMGLSGFWARLLQVGSVTAGFPPDSVLCQGNCACEHLRNPPIYSNFRDSGLSTDTAPRLRSPQYTPRALSFAHTLK